MTRVVVTGGAGFVGSHVTDRLVAEGHDVLVVDNFSTGSRHNLTAAVQRSLRGGGTLDIAEIDITTPELEHVVGRFRPAAMLHLAAQMDVRRSVADPVHDAMTNVVGTVRALESCRRHGVGKLVFTTSGGCIYGEPPDSEIPVAEGYPGHPHSPYGAAKRAVEEYFHAFSALYGLRWTSLALANVYGPRQNPAGEAGVVSIFGGRMLAGDEITIYGDGGQSRDFVYVLDVVDACLRSLTGGDGLRVNIGMGRATTINGLFDALAGITGYARTPSFAPERPGELRRIALDVSLAERSLGWRPLTDLQKGLVDTVEWLIRDSSPAAVAS